MDPLPSQIIRRHQLRNRIAVYTDPAVADRAVQLMEHLDDLDWNCSTAALTAGALEGLAQRCVPDFCPIDCGASPCGCAMETRGLLHHAATQLRASISHADSLIARFVSPQQPRLP